MSLEVTILIVTFLGVVGICALLVIPEVKKRTNKKYPRYICSLVGIIGLTLYVSFLVCMNGEHLDSLSSYKKVPIKNSLLGKFILKIKNTV